MTEVLDTPKTTTGGARYAFIKANWHASIVDKALDGFLEEMEAIGIARTAVDVIDVAGAFEVPLHAQVLAQSGRYAAIAGAALVVDGGIYRHEFVAETVVNALMRVGLDTGTPIISVILTPHQFHETQVHQRFFVEHFIKKGAEAAQACVKTVESLKRLRVLA